MADGFAARRLPRWVFNSQNDSGVRVTLHLVFLFLSVRFTCWSFLLAAAWGCSVRINSSASMCLVLHMYGGGRCALASNIVFFCYNRRTVSNGIKFCSCEMKKFALNKTQAKGRVYVSWASAPNFHTLLCAPKVKGVNWIWLLLAGATPLHSGTHRTQLEQMQCQRNRFKFNIWWHHKC